MFVEAELFILPSRNAKRCICSYQGNNKRPSVLVVNTTRLHLLVSGVGVNNGRYVLEPVQAAGIHEGAELVACDVIPGYRGIARRENAKSSSSSHSRKVINGIFCLAMRPPPNERSVLGSSVTGKEQRDDAAGSQPPLASLNEPTRQTRSTTEATREAPVLGLLHVYELQGSRGFDPTDGCLQREPQQLPLQYDPAGVTHVAVWRNCSRSNQSASQVGAAMSNAESNSVLEEKGDVVLVWGRDGRVHGYVRWESLVARGKGGGGMTSQQKKNNGRNNSSSGDGNDSNNLIAEETEAGLQALLPELKKLGNDPILSISADTLEDDSGAGPTRRVRNLMLGCRDGIYLFSSSVMVGSQKRSERVCYSYLIGGTAASVLNPSFFTSRSTLKIGEEKIIGFGCGQLGMVTCFTEGATGGETDSVQLSSSIFSFRDTAHVVGADTVLCIGCADFCRDGSTSVAIGTRSGTVTVYDILQECGDNKREREKSDVEMDTKSDGDDAFEVVWRDDEDEILEGSGGRPLGSCNHKLRHMALKWQKHVTYPVLDIIVGDFNDDGIGELVVVTLYGVHVLRPDYEQEAVRLGNFLQVLKMLDTQDHREGEAKKTDSAAAISHNVS